MHPMVFHFRLNSEESIQAIRAAAKTVTPRWAGLPAIVLTLVGIAGFARFVTKDWVESTLMAAMAVFVFPLAARLEQRLRWERAIEADPHAGEEHHIEISDDGL